jgi:hypothetical protein
MRTLIVSRRPQDAAVEKLRRLLSSLPGFSDPLFVPSESVQRKRLEAKADLAVVVLSEEQGPGQDVIQRLRETFTGQVIAVGEIADPKVIALRRWYERRPSLPTLSGRPVFSASVACL